MIFFEVVETPFPPSKDFFSPKIKFDNVLFPAPLSPNKKYIHINWKIRIFYFYMNIFSF